MEKKLKITQDLAISLLGKNDALDELLRANFSEQELSLNIMDRIKTLPDALKYNGETMEQFSYRTERDSDQEKATKELEAIALALREGKELEMGARWYYPYFNKPAGSGSGFSCSACSYVSGSSAVGAHLCVDTSEKAVYMGKQFIEIYSRHLSPKTK